MKSTFLTILAILILLGIGVMAYLTFGNYSEGCRPGTVMKISKKGLLFKTYEGQLNLGVYQGAVPQQGMAANTVWEFSVTDPAIAAQIEQSIDDGRRVKLCYEEKFYQFSWIGETKYLVNRVEEIGDAPESPAGTPLPGQMGAPATPPAPQSPMTTPPTQVTVTQ